MKHIYLDHNATTPVASEVREAMEPYWREGYGNPSSLHRMGQTARHAMDHSRETLAHFLSCQARELIFTSGGTEANNLAVKGIGRFLAQQAEKTHLVVSAVEHVSVLDAAQHLKTQEGFDVTVVPVAADGVVSAQAIEEALRPDTALVSLMHVNNETGAIQPVEELAQRLKGRQTLLHVDAAQSFGKLQIDLKRFECDLLSFSAHKAYGPKGIGALFIRQGVQLKALFHGGHQESNIRPGTENPALVVGLAKACEVARKFQKEDRERLSKLRLQLFEGLRSRVGDVSLNGALEKTLYSTLNLSFGEVDGVSLMMALDLKGICVSTGSACSAGSTEPSHVILAMGASHAAAKTSIRFSLGHDTTEAEIDYCLQVIPQVVTQMRQGRMRTQSVA